MTALAALFFSTPVLSQSVARVRDAGQSGALSRVDGLAMLPNGDVIIADMSNNSVYLLRGSRIVSTYGRSGVGPGDLSYPCCLALIDDSTFLVREGSRRYSMIRARAGKLQFVRTLPAPGNGTFDVSPVSGGRILHLTAAPTDISRHRRFDVTPVDLEGNVLSASKRRIESEPLSWQREAEVVKPVFGGESRYYVLQPFGARYLYALRADGAWLSANSGEPAVEWRDSTGKLLRTLRVPGPVRPVTVSSPERDSVEQILRAWAQGQRITRADMKLEVPRQKAPVEALGVDQDGRVWVQLSVAMGESNRAAVFSGDGRYLDTVTWPAGIQLTGWAIAGTQGVGVRLDADELPHIMFVEFSSPALRR